MVCNPPQDGAVSHCESAPADTRESAMNAVHTAKVIRVSYSKKPATVTTDALSIWQPFYEVYESPKSFAVEIELPGVDPEDCQVIIAGSVLVVRGKKKRRLLQEISNVSKSTRSFGAFCCSFALPHSAVPSKCVAEYADGVLAVTVPIDLVRSGSASPLVVVSAPESQPEPAPLSLPLPPAHQSEGPEQPRPRRNSFRRNRLYSSCSTLVIDRLKDQKHMVDAVRAALVHSASVQALHPSPAEAPPASVLTLRRCSSASAAAARDQRIDWLDPATTPMTAWASGKVTLARGFSSDTCGRVRADSSCDLIAELTAAGIPVRTADSWSSSVPSTETTTPVSEDLDSDMVGDGVLKARARGLMLPYVPLAQGDVAIHGKAVVSASQVA